MNHQRPLAPTAQQPTARPAGGWRAERGSASVELTLLTPFLVLLLVLVAVLIHRGVDTRLRLNDVAHQAARAASLARTPAGATSAAQQAATAALERAGIACAGPAVAVDTSDFRPGGLVTVTVSCRVDLTGAALLGAGASRTLTASASSPIDAWRSTTARRAPTEPGAIPGRPA